MHYNSNKYLYYDYHNVSDFEPDNLKVGLSDEYREETQFKINQAFSY